MKTVYELALLVLCLISMALFSNEDYNNEIKRGEREQARIEYMKQFTPIAIVNYNP